MADIPIPGSKNNYNTPEIRRSLLETQYKRLDRLEEEDKKLCQKKEAWQLIKEKLQVLNDKATRLTRFDGPLKQMFGNSSNPSILSANAQSNAERGEYNITVKQKAEADKFASQALPPSYKPPSGEYSFLLGEKQINFNFNGTSLNTWVKMLNTRGAGFLKAEIVRSGLNKEILIISSLKEGNKFPLIFKGKAEELASEVGILSQAKVHFVADLRGIAQTQKSPYNPISYGVNSLSNQEALILEPDSEVSIPIPKDFQLTDHSMLKLKISVQDADSYRSNASSIRSPKESVTYEGITIQNELSELNFQPSIHSAPSPKKLQALSVYYQERLYPLEPILDVLESQEKLIDLAGFPKAQEIQIANSTPNKVYLVEWIEIIDPRNRDGYLPQHAISFAQDAKLEIDGVEVERPSNKISDLISKVTLNLETSSPEMVTLKIEPDYKQIEESVANFIGAYNEFLAYANILGTRDPNVKPNDPNAKSDIVDELTWLNEAERKQAYQLLGLLQSDFVLSNLKSHLQEFLARAYDTNDERYRLLSQIGISPSTRAGQGVLRRQYLDINSSVFQNSLKENWQAVQELFSFIPLGATQASNGLAFKISDFTRPYVQFNGLLDVRIKQLNDSLKHKDQEITNYREKIDEKDRRLQTDLKKLESTLNQAEATTRSLQNYFNPKAQDKFTKPVKVSIHQA
ncbi:UNVERIFIED_CONTAM: hypothetical protein PYX00_010935 [Menopon gallinae]|uniref:Filament cap protein n=1 Tax=Menopon gallinae TaxID=328185 RepID=A0AAW2H6U3_9NEOP